MMTNIEFVDKLKYIAEKVRTLYVYGSFGSYMTESNKDMYINRWEYNRGPERKKMIKSADSDVVGFDCVCLIKGVLWGWCGDKHHKYGGAVYNSNNVPDLSANGLFSKCKHQSGNFVTHIEIGEAVWTKGHIGVYIGNGLAVECTPRWDNGVQITAVNKHIDGYNTRIWDKHGYLPWVKYVKAEKPTEKPTDKKPVQEVAAEVVAGKWGNGQERINRLKKAGYDPKVVQQEVNKLLKPKQPAKKSNSTIAKEVIQGKWGNGADRINRLKKAGYNPTIIQNEVNKLLK